MDNEVLIKLGQIANIADQSGNYELANNATKLLKSAQLWPALRTLFDPSYTPGLDRNTSYWKRLQRGWARGKIDRNLSMVLAIMAERTKINKQIDTLIEPFKLFQEQVGSFYERIRTGTITNTNFRNESRELLRLLQQTLKLMSGKELKNALRIREKLQEQQVNAASKIKGLDDETKANLMSVLQGEGLGEGIAPDEEAVPPAKDIDTQTTAMKRWLLSKKIARLPMHYGAETPMGKSQFRQFMEQYGYNPKAITEIFNSDGEGQAIGFNRFPKVFGEMLHSANQIQKDDEQSRKELTRGFADSAKIQQQEDEITTERPDTDVDLSAPVVIKPQPIASPPAPSTVVENKSKAVPEKGMTAFERASIKGLKDRIENEKRLEELKKKRRRELIEAPINPVGPTEMKKPANRTERQITRMGRMKELKKIAETEEEMIARYDAHCNCENSACEHSKERRMCSNKPNGQQAYYIGAVCDECAVGLRNSLVTQRCHCTDPICEEKGAHESGKCQTVLDRGSDNDAVCAYCAAEMEDKDIFDVNPEGQERFDEGKEYDPATMMLEEYGEGQEKDLSGKRRDLLGRGIHSELMVVNKMIDGLEHQDKSDPETHALLNKFKAKRESLKLQLQRYEDGEFPAKNENDQGFPFSNDVSASAVDSGITRLGRLAKLKRLVN